VNARGTDREEVKQEVHMVKETMSEKYLGLPVHVGRSKGGAFAYLKDQVWQLATHTGVEGKNVVLGGKGSLD